MPQEPLKLRFLGALVEQLGAQMYPSATAAVAELISNAWDADAKNVWVNIPLGEAWNSNEEIEVLDDGHGMNRQQVQDHYLNVGRKRRLQDGGETRSGRPVHGRKGLGKFAAFGTAEMLECHTVQDDAGLIFLLDYEKIRKQLSGSDHVVDEFSNPQTFLSPDGTQLSSGTKIRLTRLRLKRSIPEDRFLQSMSRRFAIDQTDMKVFINGRQLQRFDMDLEYRFPKDGIPNGFNVEVGEDGWGKEQLESGRGNPLVGGIHSEAT